LKDRRNVGGSSCNSGDGTDQMVQSFMFMMMIIITITPITCAYFQSVLPVCYKCHLLSTLLLLLLGVRGKPRMYCSLLAYCTARFGPSSFSLLDAPAPTDAFRTLAAEVGTMCGNRSINFAEMPTSTIHLGIFYMPQICDLGPTALLPFRRKVCLGIFPL
jgi:hypothetical protein